MEQLVSDPTRNNNLLDLILSIEPSTIINVTRVPGISDHEGMFFQIEICVESAQQHHEKFTNSIKLTAVL